MKVIYKMREQFMDTTLSKVLIHFLKGLKSDDALRTSGKLSHGLAA